MPELPQEILIRIIELINDYQTLYNCTLTDRSLGGAAARVLYAHIGYAPRQDSVLSLKTRDKIAEPSAFISSILLHNAANVHRLEIYGFLSTRPPKFNPLPEKLNAALWVYHNLRSVSFTPSTYHPDTFADALVLLQSLPSLGELEVNASCCDEQRAPLLVQLRRLTRLTINDPTRAILQLLPEWLETLVSTLTSFHLKGNCGSITPGVLRAFVGHLQGITSLSLGLSYSLSDQDVLDFLHQLESLEHIQLQYYLQFATPKHVAPFPRLKSLSIKHPAMDTREDVNRLCTWVRRIIASSAQLERLELLSGVPANGWNSIASVSFDGLVQHISHKHMSTIKHLELGTAFVGAKAITLLATCSQLKTITLALSLDNLVPTFRDTLGQLHNLHSVRLYTRNSRRRRCRFDNQAVSELFLFSSSLRRITINDVSWERTWIAHETGVNLSIQKVDKHPLPWDRPTPAST